MHYSFTWKYTIKQFRLKKTSTKNFKRSKMKLFLSIVALFALSEAAAYRNNRNPRTTEIAPPPEETWDYRVVEALGVKYLTLGQVVEVVYKTPNTGRVSVSLRTDNGDYAFNADVRINVFTYKNVFSLFTFTDLTGWDREVDVAGYPFTCPPVSTTTTLRITVQEESFLVTVNGMDLATFPIHENLTPDLVKTIECGLGDISAPIQGSIEKISVSF